MSQFRVYLSLVFLLCSFSVLAEGVDLEIFEALSSNIKSKQNVILQDETPLKVLSQYSQPLRKIQSTTEASESSLSTE
ncbi:MAG: hypothetical protein JNL11_00480 [Bdellovibrionaceae bacterium]|nr:hypothetical protein [Pseudobdellovibrionaceae bacterium]